MQFFLFGSGRATAKSDALTLKNDHFLSPLPHQPPPPQVVKRNRHFFLFLFLIFYRQIQRPRKPAFVYSGSHIVYSTIWIILFLKIFIVRFPSFCFLIVLLIFIYFLFIFQQKKKKLKNLFIKEFFFSYLILI